LLGLAYDRPVLVAIATSASILAAIIVARRLGWLSALRRRPAVAAVLGAVALVVVAPVAWYLVSPVFVRTRLVEPPAAAVKPSPSVQPETSPGGVAVQAAPATPAPSLAAPGRGSAAPAADASTDPSPTVTPWQPAASRSGEFTGTDDFHFGRGKATLTETEPGAWTLRFEDFSVRNGPDLYVYLSPDRDGYARGSLEVARLKATDGSFNIALPEGADPSSHRSVLIWCKQFSHLFAFATLD
jgi:hypothetical protein